MGIFDKFTSKPQKGYAEVKVEFTQEESAAVTSSMDEYASIWAAQHGGEGFVTPVKMKSGMMARALTEYAADLVAQCDDGNSEECLKKAIQAQAKAYALHNLPVFIFQLAGLYEVAGDTTKAREFLQHFLRAQHEFTPDVIDTTLLDQSGFDMAKVSLLAKQKLDGSLGYSSDARFVVIPITEGKCHAIATNLVSVANDAVPGFCAENMTALELEPAHRPIFECLCFALFLTVAEVVIYDKYTEEDAQAIMIRAFECFFGAPAEERLTTSFQEAFNHAHERYVSIWRLSVPLLDLTEGQMYEEWARTFTSELAILHGIACSQRKVERWALAAIGAFRDGCYSL
jgi:hypothetical protein